MSAGSGRLSSGGGRAAVLARLWCGECGLLLHAAVVADGFLTHPACGPDDARPEDGGCGPLPRFQQRVAASMADRGAGSTRGLSEAPPAVGADPGCCVDGVTIVARCGRCGGTASKAVLS